jgi:undecaprenyl-diphosphatase
VRTAYLILLATVPGALIGFFFEDFFATKVRSPWVVVINLVFVGVLFLVAEAVGPKTESAIKLGPLGALGIGLAQAAALLPGVSRSGATITCGQFLGLEPFSKRMNLSEQRTLSFRPLATKELIAEC